MNDSIKAVALGECKLTFESYYYCKEYLTISLLVFKNLLTTV